MAKFDIKLDKVGTTVKVTMVGTIDEDVDFNKYPIDGAEQIVLELENIKSINSCGIREWIKWINTVPNAKVEYHLCPKIIVDQINMVQGFLPTHGAVKSFYVPFYSDESGEEKNILFHYGKEFDQSGMKLVPSIKGDDGKEMEMDVVETKYFKFLKKSA